MSTAAIDRPIALRMRPDLVVVEQWFRGRPFFVVKDPLRLAYSYLTQQEYFILAALDGGASSATIEERFATRFAPQRITPSQLHGFVAQLHRSGLVLGETAGQGYQLTKRRAEQTKWNTFRWLEKLLAFRWRGIDPEPLLRWLDPKVGWIFSLFGLLVWGIVVFSAGFVLVTRFEELQRRAPDVEAWLSAEQLPWLAVALIVVKTLHELGHALAARRMGCRSRELGIQLFLFLPCLYTDVSDVWLVPNKWGRMVVSAAGMYVELFLAATSAIVWSLAEPGVLSSLCQNVFVVASIGTLALNGNPLLRYDGYHILADLLEIPNLERRAQAQLMHALAWWTAGVQWWPPDELNRRARPMLALVAVASLAYRAVVLAGVYLVMTAMFRPLGLEPAAGVFAGLAVLGIVYPLASLLKQIIVQVRATQEISFGRLAISGVVALSLLLACFYVPLPQRIAAPATIEPRGASRIYASVSGELGETLPVGTEVKAGDVVARLENLALKRDVVRLETEKRQQELVILELETIRGDDPAAAAGIPAARESLADLNQRIIQLHELIGRLTLVAPQDGMVFAPPNRRNSPAPRELAAWSGTPLDPFNRGATIEASTLVGLVARPRELEAIAVVHQADAPLIQPGSRVYLKIDQTAGGTILGKVEQVARADTDELPLHLAATGAIPGRREEGKGLRPLATVYQVRIAVDDAPAELLPGAMGRVRIVGVAEPIAARVRRWLAKTFRFRL